MAADDNPIWADSQIFRMREEPVVGRVDVVKRGRIGVLRGIAVVRRNDGDTDFRGGLLEVFDVLALLCPVRRQPEK